jgi:hypothetical protein
MEKLLVEERSREMLRHGSEAVDVAAPGGDADRRGAT